MKMLFQKRTYFGWAGLFIVPFLIAIAVHFNRGSAGAPKTPSRTAPDFYFGIIAANGLYVAIAALFALSCLLLPLLAAVSGSQTACRPRPKRVPCAPP